MKTIQDLFLSTKPDLEKTISEMLEVAMNKIYTEYLPHVESDTCSNVYFQTQDWLEKFFADKLTDEDVKFFPLKKDYSYLSEVARQKVYEANKEEIAAMIGRDLQDKIDRLEAQLYESYRRYL